MGHCPSMTAMRNVDDYVTSLTHLPNNYGWIEIFVVVAVNGYVTAIGFYHANLTNPMDVMDVSNRGWSIVFWV